MVYNSCFFYFVKPSILTEVCGLLRFNHRGYMNCSLYSTDWFPILLLRVAGRRESEREVVCVRLLKGCRDWLVPSEDLRLSISVYIDAYMWVFVCVCLHLPLCFRPLGYSVVYAPSQSSVWGLWQQKVEGGRTMGEIKVVQNNAAFDGHVSKTCW